MLQSRLNDNNEFLNISGDIADFQTTYRTVAKLTHILHDYDAVGTAASALLNNFLSRIKTAIATAENPATLTLPSREMLELNLLLQAIVPYAVIDTRDEINLTTLNHLIEPLSSGMISVKQFEFSRISAFLHGYSYDEINTSLKTNFR